MLNIKDHWLSSRNTLSTPVLRVPLVANMKSVSRGVMCVSQHLFLGILHLVYALSLVAQEDSSLNEAGYNLEQVS